MVIGVLGSFLPVVPGGVLVFFGILFYAWATQFRLIDWRWLIVFALLTIAAYLLDWIATAWGATRYGAGSGGVIGAIVCGIFGLIIFGVFGSIIGSFVGAFLGELIGGKSISQARRAGWGTLLGLLTSVVLQLMIYLFMIVLFLMIVF